jgi:uncharacterized membrane protein YgdD (TMEM256/DUF423 family)
MSTSGRILMCLAAASLLLATLLGAYGSHALAPNLDASHLAAYQTAVQYQFYHGLGLAVVALLLERHPQARLLWGAAAALVAGLLCFCGGIYATTLGAPAALGMLIPFGGIAFMVAWLSLGLGVWLQTRHT